jgi:hypothetical protein
MCRQRGAARDDIVAPDLLAAICSLAKVSKGYPPVVRYIRITDLARAVRQSLERKIVIGKVLIVGQLEVLHPYLPDRSRLAREL